MYPARGASRKGEGKKFNVYLSPEVAALLYEEEKSSIEYLESTFKTKVDIIADPDFSVESYQVESVF